MWRVVVDMWTQQFGCRGDVISKIEESTLSTKLRAPILNLLRKYTTQSRMKLDPAVVKLLDLDVATTTVSSAGGGGCSSASTSKIVSKLQDGTAKVFFMKTGSGEDAKVMFEGRSYAKTRRGGVILR
jgi:hypothetical protein